MAIESAWSDKQKSEYKDVVICEATITEINSNKATSQIAIKSQITEPTSSKLAPLNESVSPQSTKFNGLKIWQLALAGIAAMLFVSLVYIVALKIELLDG